MKSNIVIYTLKYNGFFFLIKELEKKRKIKKNKVWIIFDCLRGPKSITSYCCLFVFLNIYFSIVFELNQL